MKKFDKRGYLLPCWVSKLRYPRYNIQDLIVPENKLEGVPGVANPAQKVRVVTGSKGFVSSAQPRS